jgi:hypothetical protein
MKNESPSEKISEKFEKKIFGFPANRHPFQGVSIASFHSRRQFNALNIWLESTQTLKVWVT